MVNLMPHLKLRHFALGARLGLIAFVLALAGGYLLASYLHMVEHYQNRDGRPGMSFTDVKSAYHGATVPSPLLTALRRNHPPEMPAGDRAELLRWLEGGNAAANYDNPDFADFSPKELLDTHCVSCHAGAAERGAGLSLRNWPEVQKVAFSVEVFPTDRKILLASLHAHASTMGAIGLVVALLALLTSWPRWLTGGLVLLAGLGLAVDVGSWWPARSNEAFVYAIVAGGVTHSASMAALMLLIVVDLLRPGLTTKTG